MDLVLYLKNTGLFGSRQSNTLASWRDKKWQPPARGRMDSGSSLPASELTHLPATNPQLLSSVV